MPFDGLFLEQDNRSISKLLFLLTTWHAYAKLHLHTESTLEMLELVSRALCQALRHFTSVTCPQYTMKELPQEVRQCLACQQAQAACGHPRAGNTTSSSRTGQVKLFNMSMYKMHHIPNYPDAIWKHGTMDSYSTHMVCQVRLNTKTVIVYCRASLHTAYPSCGISYPTRTVASLDRSQTKKAACGSMLNCLGAWLGLVFHPPPKWHNQNLIWRKGKMGRTKSMTAIGCPRGLPLPETSQNGLLKMELIMHWRQVLTWLMLYNANLNFNKDFQTHLVDHLLARIKGIPYNGDEYQFTDQDRNNIIIDQGQLYKYKTIQFRPMNDLRCM